MASEQMKFPGTWEEYEKDYGFNDSKEVYTNNSRLIPSFRVKQWLNHLPSIQPKTGHWIVYEDCEGKTRRCVCDRCRHETGDYTWKNPNFCENCGAKMVEPQESEVKE